MKKVDSSSIEAIHYTPETNMLEVQFKRGGLYRYSGVSEKTYENFENSSSLGDYLHTHIKPRHAAKKIPHGR